MCMAKIRGRNMSIDYGIIGKKIKEKSGAILQNKTEKSYVAG